ncbi:excinuclease ABC subunit UvrA [Chitinispirillales bacterium ANBcel5]|uniref:excinuclease ABC subunit UvrA n=1 Tax=Cellulosispirillum alkaliphilum TaxID=3039283 RepID=UPI002A505D5B|nr:excinuclease ABC subunit UvrA [Chitinispirillales bacterium ANBcel5]
MSRSKKEAKSKNHILLEGATQNNLKNLTLSIPLNKFVVVTGVSGSGKSSLAFDTIYAEGQRRYIETFSSYARQFLDRMDKPGVERISGIPPAIAIDQTNPVRTSRSTVGTMTELNDHLKLLYARAAKLYCKSCGKIVQKETAESIYSHILDNEVLKSSPAIAFTFKIKVPESFTESEVLELLSNQGYNRIHSKSGSTIEVIQDRVHLNTSNRQRIVEDIENALKHGNGVISVYPMESDGTIGVEAVRFSSGLHCASCDIDYSEPQPNHFSFNSPLGACEKCKGFGKVIGVDYSLVIPDPTKSLREGAVRPWQTDSYRECQDDLLSFARKRSIPLDKPWNKLSKKHKKWVFEGEGSWEDGCWYGVNRFFEWLESKSYKMHIRVLLSRYRTYQTCQQCSGARLKDQSLWWKIEGYSIHDIMLLSLRECFHFFQKMNSEVKDDEALELILKEITTRLGYLVEVGLGYLTLDRQSRTLSGGEVQRINLTTALGTSLVNTLFVLDEPSIGLHPRDISRLITILQRLRDSGNSLIVVEHDPDVIRAADHVIDIGPGPGKNGGNIVFDGTISQLIKCKTSNTAAFLSGEKSVYSTNPQKVALNKDCIRVRGASEHNLKNIDVSIPLNRLVCVTGVSGSGKSTLIHDVLYNNWLRQNGKGGELKAACGKIEGIEQVSEMIFVDQSPIGKTTRSNPASYVKALDPIRKLFASQPLSRARGYTPGTFSFNSGNGRCPACNGNGYEHVDMQFLSDIYIRCSDCNGTRFRSEIQDVTLSPGNDRPYSIANILDLTVEEALLIFVRYPQICKKLQPLADVGLSYLTLGQPVPTLSGGEAQRLKLAGHLSSANTANNIVFLFDEPTTGLHFQDISLLMKSFKSLIDSGHSVIVIEHNVDVISNCDWIIDLGPEGGDEGGEVVCAGTPKQIANCTSSFTGAALLSTKVSSVAAVKHSKGNNLLTMPDDITIRNAREHNLKNIDITIPRNKFTVITGVSGSGKSTIAFDILFAEGQRRYLESLNAYARQFVQPSARPDVDSINGVPPTVAIEQRTSRGGRKSTVATVTELYHYLRLILVKLGTQYCPDCSIPIEPRSQDSIVSSLIKTNNNKKIRILAPLVSSRKGIYKDLAAWAQDKGYTRLKVDGKFLPTDNWPTLDRFKEHTIELPIGELIVDTSSESVLREYISTAIKYGKGTIKVEIVGRGNPKGLLYSTERNCPKCGSGFQDLDPRLFSFNSKQGWCDCCYGTGLKIKGFDELQTGEEALWNEWWDGEERLCDKCNGKRLRPEALAVLFKGKSIYDLTFVTVQEAIVYFQNVTLSTREEKIARDIIKELLSRLWFLESVGLGYLTLDRAAPTLSGGEAQRIRLASQLGSNLQGVCYILDEPTIGLHPRDNLMLLDTLYALKNKGNSVVVVEHDEETIRRAEYLIDLGPGGGVRGGQILSHGPINKVLKSKSSITAKYLREPIEHTTATKRSSNNDSIQIMGASLHNLKSVDVSIPLERFVCVTGVSGSGKSTLVRDILFNNLKTLLSKKTVKNSSLTGCKYIRGYKSIARVLEVDQTPIGKTPRSCPATYVGLWDEIRKLYSRTNEANIRGYTPSRFSFNVEGGRCAACKGQGTTKIEMSFLPDVSLPCEVCNGARFSAETLKVLYRGKSIGDVLAMSIDEAVEFFSSHASIHKTLKLLQDVGLGYLSLGQQSPALSGGEAQRIKLVSELRRSLRTASSRTKKAVNTLYVLDEPTIGLHMGDVEKLISVFQKLVDEGNTVVVIEHDLDVIAEADWVIDLGPEGGSKGGNVIAEGTPFKLLKSSKKSHTAKFLKKVLQRDL